MSYGVAGLGLTYDETAAALGISKATVARDWEFVASWPEVSAASIAPHAEKTS